MKRRTIICRVAKKSKGRIEALKPTFGGMQPNQALKHIIEIAICGNTSCCLGLLCYKLLVARNSNSLLMHQSMLKTDKREQMGQNCKNQNKWKHLVSKLFLISLH